jgi:hypothetical protein
MLHFLYKQLVHKNNSIERVSCNDHIQYDWFTNENIYFENYYDEQRKFERII